MIGQLTFKEQKNQKWKNQGITGNDYNKYNFPYQYKKSKYPIGEMFYLECIIQRKLYNTNWKSDYQGFMVDGIIKYITYIAVKVIDYNRTNKSQIQIDDNDKRQYVHFSKLCKVEEENIIDWVERWHKQIPLI